MSLSVATGTFAIGTVTGTLEIDISPAFQPKVVIAWWTRSTADATFSANQAFGFGVAVDDTADQQMHVTFLNTDNVSTTSSTSTKRTDSFIRNQSTIVPAWNVIATISSFDSDGFTINRTANDGANNNIIHYLCLGGSEITDAVLLECTGPGAGVTGNLAFTGVGFQGNLGLFFACARPNASGSTAFSDYAVMVGAAKSSTERCVVTAYGDHGTTNTGASQSESYINDGKCLAIPNSGIGAPDHVADFVSWDADGFTLNYSTAVTASFRFFALVLQGTFQASIGQQARLTSNTTQDVTTGFQPAGVLLAGTFATATDTQTAGGHILMGAGTSSSDDHGNWAGDAATINTDCNQYSSASNIYTQATNPSTVAAQANLDSMLSTGFRMNWSTTDATARRYMHLALGDAASTTVLPTTSDAVTVDEGTTMHMGLNIPLMKLT